MKRNPGSVRFAVLLMAAVLLAAYIPASASGSAQVIGTVTITNPNYVNVRSGGGTSYEVIAQVQPGSVYPCVGIAASGWYAILLDDGRTGYVSNTITSFTPAQPPVQTPRPPYYYEVQVPIYYRDSTGALLYTDYVNLTAGGSVIKPNNLFVPGYRLLGPSEVTVSVSQALAAIPRSVTFLYTRNAVVTPKPQPAYTTVPVSYFGPDGRAFYSASVQVWPGYNYIQPDYTRVPSAYALSSSASVQVYVDSAGRVSPASVLFYFQWNTVPVTPKPVTPAPVTPPPVPTAPPSGDIAGYLPDFVKTKPNAGSYPVYTGPSEGYYRVGNATLGGGTIRVYGQENGWALIGYGLSNGGYRIGFVSMSAIPSDIYPQELILSWIPKTNVSASLFVDDPIVSKNRELIKRYEGGSPFVLLGYLNDFWAYVQIENFEGTGQPARGFVSRRSLGV